MVGWRSGDIDRFAKPIFRMAGREEAEQRVSVVRNLVPCYSANNVQPGQKLYLTPEQRVRIW